MMDAPLKTGARLGREGARQQPLLAEQMGQGDAAQPAAEAPEKLAAADVGRVVRGGRRERKREAGFHKSQSFTCRSSTARMAALMERWLISRGGSPAMPNASRESIRAKTIFMRLVIISVDRSLPKSLAGITRASSRT